jgi:translation initiation factor 3 subunit C
MFELEVNSVHALVSKMIINEELMASLDQPSQCIVMHRSVNNVMHQLMITVKSSWHMPVKKVLYFS